MESQHHILDATGLICPLPVLRAKKRLQAMSAGETLQVITTDKAAMKDFPAFCDMAHYTLIRLEHDENRTVFFIRK